MEITVCLSGWWWGEYIERKLIRVARISLVKHVVTGIQSECWCFLFYYVLLSASLYFFRKSQLLFIFPSLSVMLAKNDCQWSSTCKQKYHFLLSTLLYTFINIYLSVSFIPAVCRFLSSLCVCPGVYMSNHPSFSLLVSAPVRLRLFLSFPFPWRVWWELRSVGQVKTTSALPPPFCPAATPPPVGPGNA